MSNPSREQYLESKVFTASQPKLHLMLLDGAMRFGNQAKDAWTDGGDFAKVDESLQRMFDIVEELLQGLACGEGEISEQLAEQYAFVYRELAVCRVQEDPQKLEKCLELLSFQRETWKLASERVDGQQADTQQTTASAPSAKPAMPHMKVDTAPTSEGLSLEA